jgi:hypothetical protein
MNPMSNRYGVVPGIVLGLLALALSPAHADWLVTHEGGRVETRGSWQTKGKLVVFTRAADGALASLRASEVDLDASAKLTAAAKVKAEAPPPPEAPQKKIAVLTDKDFRRPAPADDGAAPEGAPPAAHAGPLVVSDWKRVDLSSGEGLSIEGVIHNTTDGPMINASIEVQLYNEVGDRVGTAPGLLASTSLKPDGTVQFRANFPGVFTYARAKFEVNGLPVNMSPPASPDPKPADKTPPP